MDTLAARATSRSGTGPALLESSFSAPGFCYASLSRKRREGRMTNPKPEQGNGNGAKTCFVVGPIGEPGSDVRRLADWLLHGIVKQVLEPEPFVYKVLRADDIAAPGLITDQVIIAIHEADLVVADLTHQNPNAFYELAIRHMVEKPVIHMIHEGHPIPFDNKDYRAIHYRVDDYAKVEAAKATLVEQAKAIEAEDYRVSNPITRARGFQKLAESSDPRDLAIANLEKRIDELSARMNGPPEEPRSTRLADQRFINPGRKRWSAEAYARWKAAHDAAVNTDEIVAFRMNEPDD